MSVKTQLSLKSYRIFSLTVCSNQDLNKVHALQLVDLSLRLFLSTDSPHPSLSVSFFATYLLKKWNHLFCRSSVVWILLIAPLWSISAYSSALYFPINWLLDGGLITFTAAFWQDSLMDGLMLPPGRVWYPIICLFVMLAATGDPWLDSLIH